MTHGKTRLSLRAAVAALVALIAVGAAEAQSLVLNGSAAIVSGRLRLTPAGEGHSGSAWLGVKQPVAAGFTATFRFQITEPGGAIDALGATGADGFTFVVQNFSPTALSGGGGNIGYGDGIPNSLAVEFDTWYNAENNDPNNNHISVHTRGTAPNSSHESFSLGASTRIPDLSDGRVHTATITYQTSPAGGVLRVFIDGSAVLGIRLNLAQLLALDNGRAFVGFTAGTGGAFENHDILSWSFRSL